MKYNLPYIFGDEQPEQSKWVPNEDYNNYLKAIGYYLLKVFDLSERKLSSIVKIYHEWFIRNGYDEKIYQNGIFNQELLIDTNIYRRVHTGEY